MGSMFFFCNNLTNFDFSYFDTKNVTYIDNMFYDLIIWQIFIYQNLKQAINNIYNVL